MKESIENIELRYLTIADYKELKEVMIEAYSSMPNSYWKESHIESLIRKFPEGQVIIKINASTFQKTLAAQKLRSLIAELNAFYNTPHHTNQYTCY